MSSNNRDDSQTASGEPRDTIRTTPTEQVEPLIPDSYSAHVPPTTLPGLTQHKTVELATIKLKSQEEHDAELRRRVTVRTQKQHGSSPSSSDAPIALEGRLVLPSWPWLLLAAGGALLVFLIAVVVVVSSKPAAPVAQSAHAVPAEAVPSAVPLPAATTIEPVAQSAPGPPQASAPAQTAVAAAPKPKPAKPTASPKESASAPKTSPPAGATIDVRRDVPF